MKCRKCGREAAGNERYCIGCGSDLWIPAAQRSPYVAKAKKTQAEKYADKKKKNKILLICCVWGIVLVALLVFLLGRHENDAGAPTENAEVVAAPEQTEEASVRAEAAQWSGWLDALPADVSQSEYQIETKTQYRARSKETTSAAQETLDGWTLVASATGDGGFGAWSDWGLTTVAASDEREVQTQTRYRYREKETTTSDAPSLSGWEHMMLLTHGATTTLGRTGRRPMFPQATAGWWKQKRSTVTATFAMNRNIATGAVGAHGRATISLLRTI